MSDSFPLEPQHLIERHSAKMFNSYISAIPFGRMSSRFIKLRCQQYVILQNDIRQNDTSFFSLIWQNDYQQKQEINGDTQHIDSQQNIYSLDHRCFVQLIYLTLSTNIRLGYDVLTLTNTLAYSHLHS
jgi:hypothetical protein